MLAGATFFPSRANLITVSCECLLFMPFCQLSLQHGCPDVQNICFHKFLPFSCMQCRRCSCCLSPSLHTQKYTVSRSSFSVHMVQTCINVHLQILAHPLSVANAVFMTGAHFPNRATCVRLCSHILLMDLIWSRWWPHRHTLGITSTNLFLVEVSSLVLQGTLCSGSQSTGFMWRLSKREKEKLVSEPLQCPWIRTSQPITQTQGWLSYLSPNRWAPHTTRYTYMHLHTLFLSQHDIRDLRYPIWLHIIHAFCPYTCMHMILLSG